MPEFNDSKVHKLEKIVWQEAAASPLLGSSRLELIKEALAAYKVPGGTVASMENSTSLQAALKRQGPQGLDGSIAKV